MTTTSQLQSRRVRVPDSFAAMQDYFWEQGWTDGLPVVPPTEDAVREMLAAIESDPQHSLGVMQPPQLPRHPREDGHQRRHGRLQARALPSRCGRRTRRPHRGLQPRRHGRYHRRRQPGHDRQPALSPPSWASSPTPVALAPASAPTPPSAAPCVSSSATSPDSPRGRWTRPLSVPRARYSFCFAENEGRSPWEPLHVERGYDPDSSTVTMAGHSGRLPHHGEHLRDRLRRPRHHRR